VTVTTAASGMAPAEGTLGLADEVDALGPRPTHSELAALARRGDAELERLGRRDLRAAVHVRLGPGGALVWVGLARRPAP
jgi:hypothetical protein